MGRLAEIAKGLVDQAVEVEKKGLTGKVYVDARGMRYDPNGGDCHRLLRLRRIDARDGRPAGKRGENVGRARRQAELFKPGSCPECACIAAGIRLRTLSIAADSSKARSPGISPVRRGDFAAAAQCEILVQEPAGKGAAATLGPVAEPYTIGFPKPEEFFGFLATGKYTLVRRYAHRILSSWMTVLVGDPLYNPFAKNPRLKEEQVLPSPKGPEYSGQNDCL